MFEKVLGHKEAKEKLENDIKNDKISQAYLFYGENGIGKKFLANEFAKLILNTEKLETSADYMFVSQETTLTKSKTTNEMIEKFKSEITVDQVRKIVESSTIVPATGKYKVYVIDMAEKLNIIAQNALLKTLEEPAFGVVIILITNNISNIIPTVLSRVTKICFNKLSNEQIKSVLNVDISEIQLKLANGSLSKAQNIVSGRYGNKYENISILVESIEKKDIIECFERIKEIDLKDEDIVETFENIILERKRYNFVESIEKAKQMILANTNEDLVKTTLMIDMCK